MNRITNASLLPELLGVSRPTETFKITAGVRQRSPSHAARLLVRSRLPCGPDNAAAASIPMPPLRSRKLSTMRTIFSILGFLVLTTIIQGLLENISLGKAELVQVEESKVVDSSVAVISRDNTPSQRPSVTKQNESLSSTTTTPEEASPKLLPEQKSDKDDGPAMMIQLPPRLNNSHSFVDTYCDLQGLDWYGKSSGNSSWAPANPQIILPGFKFSGTSVLTKLLNLHPTIRLPRPHAETRFFLNSHIEPYLGPPPPRQQQGEVTVRKIRVKDARQALWKNHHVHLGGQNQGTRHISIDTTPGYLFYSTHLPYRLLCVAPWVKLVVLLRDPIDRMRQQYAAARKVGWRWSVDEYLQRDLRLLQRSGVLSNHTHGHYPRPIDITKSVDREDEAWRVYSTSPGEGGPIGRSMYDISLRHWLQALDAAGREPRDAVLIMWTEELVKAPRVQYQRLVDFLGLPAAPTPSLSTLKRLVGGLKPAPDNKHPLSNDMQKQMRDLFRMYEKRLNQLLKKYGMEDGRSTTKKEAR